MDILNGPNNNVHFTVCNQHNLDRKRRLEKNTFFDNLGVWDSSKGNAVTTDYVISDGFSGTSNRNGVYCAPKQIRGHKTWIPLYWTHSLTKQK